MLKPLLALSITIIPALSYAQAPSLAPLPSGLAPLLNSPDPTAKVIGIPTDKKNTLRDIVHPGVYSMADGLLMRGRRMIPASVPTGMSKVKGSAPEGEGAPFRILSGSETLWQGKAGESFSVSIPKGSNHIYLLSTTANNIAWGNMRWGIDEKATASKTKAAGELVIKAKNHGLRPGKKCASVALRKLITKARAHAGSCLITLEKGEYHFYPKSSKDMSVYISNHDQQDMQAVAIPIVDVKKLFILDGQGSTFVFHDNTMPFLIMDSRDTIIENIHITHHQPWCIEGTIVSNHSNETILEIPSKVHAWQLKDGHFEINSDGTSRRVNHAIAYKSNGRIAALGNIGDIPWSSAATKVDKNSVKFNSDTRELGLSAGDVLVLRNYARPRPAMLAYRSKNIQLNNVFFHDSQGMAFLAQRCDDISITGGGCLRSDKRMHTSSADATHFSNCRGHIRVLHATYEGMMDDAINVHSTALQIDEIISPTQFLCSYKHPQAVGFEVLLAGERLQFIKAKTMEHVPQSVLAQHVEKLSETQLRVTLNEPLPAGVSVGDAWENADWYPSVHFHHNTVRYNRARGALFNTPRPVLIEDNHFYYCSGSAILLAGDAQGWYETGRCLDMLIRRNRFDHNLTSSYQFCEGIISIIPQISKHSPDETPYHQNIVIEDNIFTTHAVPLLYAESSKNIFFRNNRMIKQGDYQGKHDGHLFIQKHCGPCKLEAPLQLQPLPAKKPL